MRQTIRAAAVTIGSALLLLGSASAAFADPLNAPNRLVGTADCGPDGTFDFIVNSGNTEATTWGPAFITGSDGQRGLFLPASFDLTFTSPFGTFTSVDSKRTAPGPVSCTITGNPVGFPEATLTGMVTGTIVATG
jgi:hypothetical protein